MHRVLRRFLPQSIRAQLVAVVATVAVPLCALLVLSGVREYRLTVAYEERTALTLAEAAALTTREFMLNAEGLMTSLVDEFGPDLLAEAPCSSVIRRATSVFGFLSNLLVTDISGRVVCAGRPVPAGSAGTLPTPWPASPAGGRSRVGPPVYGGLAPGWGVELVTPIEGEDGSGVGHLVGVVDLQRLQEALDRVRLFEDELLTLVTGDGTILARSVDPEQHVGRYIGPDTVNNRNASAVPQGLVSEAVDLAGERRAFGKVDLPELGWRATVGVPVARARQPALLALIRTGLLSLLVGLGAAAVAWWSYRRITASLDHLRRGARAAAEGEAAVVMPDAPEEFLDVVSQLNSTLEARARAQMAERGAKERYRSILENAVFGICVTSPEGAFLEVNPALASMLGYDAPEALKEVGVHAVYRDPSERQALVSHHLRTGIIAGVELEWVRKDGEPVVVRLNGKAIEKEPGKPAFEVIVEDITNERRREQELRHHQKMEAVGQMAGGIAHDFNNLLTVIMGNVELVRAGLDAESPLHADVTQALEASERATQLTRQLLAFSRKTDGRDRQAVDVDELILNVERMLSRLVGERITIDTRLAGGLPTLHADPSQLEQVIFNLVLNARDALPEGGTILLQTRATRLGGEAAVALEVRDDGIGMDAATCQRVFEPFFTTKPKGRGTGLGLATVYGIVQEAGGDIAVESHEGVGTAFEVVFPATAPERAPSEAVSASPDAMDTRRGPERILVVEDKESVRTLVRRILEREGYQVHLAEDGQDALEQVEDGRVVPDLVLTDVVMPRMKGPELADRLRAMNPALPILFMSGYLDSPELRARFSGRSEVLLAKPFTAVEVKSRVRQALRPAPIEG